METIPTYHCQRSQLPHPPDARLDVAPWSTATWITQFRCRDGAPLPDDRYLRVALLWDDEALHVTWGSAPSLVPVTKTERDDDLWTECTAELFLAAGAGYYEFEVNPLGAVLDLHFPAEEDDDWLTHRQWDAPGLTWAVRSHGPGVGGSAPWSAQMRIPWAAMPELGREATPDGDVLLAQVCRAAARPDGGSELPAWGPAQKKFCERAGMGRVVLVG